MYTVWNGWVDNSCFEIIFQDWDDSTVETTDGFYQIWMNNKTVAFGEYSQTVETIIVCSDENHMSFCVTPEYCTNNNDIFITGTDTVDDIYIAKSYHSLINCQLENQLTYPLECLGMKSCINMYSESSDIKSYGAFGLNESEFLIEYQYNYSNISNFAFDNADILANADKTVECYGLHSCQNTQSFNTIGYGTMSCNDIIYTSNLDINGSLVIVNSEIILMGIWYMMFCSSACIGTYNDVIGGAVIINLSDGYYSLFNTTIKCSHQVFSTCTIYCSKNDNPQYFILDDSCSSICTTVNCFNLIDNISEIDNTSLNIINQLNELLTNLSDIYIYECDSDDSVTYDTSIGALASNFGDSSGVDNSIYNSINGAPVCCRGYESCSSTPSIYTSLGNILCLGYKSCSNVDLIWTGDDNDVTTQASIFCVTELSCYNSLLQADSNIICSSYYSCQNSVIWQSSKLFCTMNACINTRIRKVEIIYFIDSQTNAIIHSGYIGETKIYFRGINAGNDVTYYCDTGDTCYFDCGENSCNNSTTKLYCYGKCFVECYDQLQYNATYRTSTTSTDCVNIITSLAPTVTPTTAPSQAPSIAPSGSPSFLPTVAPTIEPTIVPTETPSNFPSSAPTTMPSWSPTESGLFTEEELASYFNWVIGVLIIISIIVLILGLISAKHARNELYEWKPILLFSIYANDFFSGTVCVTCVLQEYFISM